MASFSRTAAVAALVLAPHAVDATGTSATMTRANPIRRVVNMLQGMSKKIEAEGEKEEKMYEKFFCYCKNGAGQLEKEIADAEAKIPQLEASIKETEGAQEQLGSGTSQAKKDREEAKAAVAEATALREKEAAAYASASAEAQANIDAMGKAIGALEAGGASSFLQTPAAAVLKKVTMNADLSSSDRDAVAAFLSTGEGDEDTSAGSGEIVGILKQMKETMEGDLTEATAAEEESKKSFDSLVASKNKEIEALTASIEEKITRNGEGGVALAEMKEDLDDTSKALVENKKLAGDLDKNCATKKAEWEERSKMRGEELLAIADTIKILNSDDALELFKKTLPSASLLQVTASSKEMRAQAAAMLEKKKGHRDARIDLISLALKGKKVSFDKVIAMVDEMVGILGAEQKDDDSKKTYCEGEIDKTEDEIKELKLKGSDLAKAADEAKGSIATLTDEIAALEQGVKDLDAQVAEATEQRKEENAEFKDVKAGNAAAIELLGMAKNRLNKFYNPKLAKFVQVQEAQPETPSGPYKKSEESNGVLAMIDMLVQDLEKENTEMEVEEKNAQEEYEQAMKDSTEKRSTDLKSIEEKEGAKADAEASLDKIKADTKATLDSEMATAEILSAIHKECDWLLSNYDVRKEARASEIEALGKAKAVLSGADYSFLQTKATHATIRSLRGA